MIPKKLSFNYFSIKHKKTKQFFKEGIYLKSTFFKFISYPNKISPKFHSKNPPNGPVEILNQFLFFPLNFNNKIFIFFLVKLNITF